MAEFTYNPVQLVEAGQNVTFTNQIGCGKGYILHRDGSGIVTLRGAVNNPCGKFARYRCTFVGNIALPEGATAGPISVALALNGEPLQPSRAIFTPSAADIFGNVTCTSYIDVPVGCCVTVAVENTSTQAINVQNANLVITREG